MSHTLSPVRPASLSSGRYLDTPRGDDWREQAICGGGDYDIDLWFPNGNSGPALVQAEEAKAVCRRCPVMETCLQWAIENRQEAGVWGGLSEDERRSLIRRAQRKALQHRKAVSNTADTGKRVLGRADTVALLRAAGLDTEGRVAA